VLPRREKERSEIDDPKLRKSMMLTADPRRDIP
jgi:hypothetical protein